MEPCTRDGSPQTGTRRLPKSARLHLRMLLAQRSRVQEVPGGAVPLADRVAQETRRRSARVPTAGAAGPCEVVWWPSAQPNGWGLGDRACSPPRSSMVCDDTEAAPLLRGWELETQADFPTLDLSPMHNADVGDSGANHGDPAGTSAQAHETMALARNASDALLSGAFCKLHVADFPVDKSGLAMWPRAEMLVGSRRVRSSGKKRACTDAEVSDRSDSDPEEVEGEVLLPGVRHAKRAKHTV